MNDRPTAKLLDALHRTNGVEATPSGQGWKALCPAHDDHNPSLSISEGSDGNVLVRFC